MTVDEFIKRFEALENKFESAFSKLEKIKIPGEGKLEGGTPSPKEGDAAFLKWFNNKNKEGD